MYVPKRAAPARPSLSAVSAGWHSAWSMQRERTLSPEIKDARFPGKSQVACPGGYYARIVVPSSKAYRSQAAIRQGYDPCSLELNAPDAALIPLRLFSPAGAVEPMFQPQCVMDRAGRTEALPLEHNALETLSHIAEQLLVTLLRAVGMGGARRAEAARPQFFGHLHPALRSAFHHLPAACLKRIDLSQVTSPRHVIQ